ncbi:hypothetical protein [Amycolatopsis sp. NPDC059021]|uniref:hypothetical protein n=1 Tax=Amycolatopsis sp. NPDC059021 TaxID=3346704 RepID=UPI0036715D1A
MSARGRRASLPPVDHARPEYLSNDGLVVHHYNRAGRVKHYDFTVLPVAEPMQRSLAALFAAGCVPHRWTTHESSQRAWFAVAPFAQFLSHLQHPPHDLDEVTVDVVVAWRAHCSSTGISLQTMQRVTRLLRDDARLQTGRVADELARRVKTPKSTVLSYSEAEFDRIQTAARRTFRSALLRIEDNARHLDRWRAGEFSERGRDWVIGEALNVLARTGDVPRHAGQEKRSRRVLARYRTALGGNSAAFTWQRLFLSRLEAVALGVLLLAQYGWNLSVIAGAAVPRALPDPGEDGNPTYRIPLEKPRRGPVGAYETRNVTDDGAASRGRLITEALRATRFARAIVEDLTPGTDRLIVWRCHHPTRPDAHSDHHPPVGPFRFGIPDNAALEWARTHGFGEAPFRRGRRTVIALDRREPTQHSQDTHDRHYAVTDKHVQEEAVEIIAAGAQDANNRARSAVLVAELRDQPTPGDTETATADCGDFDHSPFAAADSGCGASFLLCLACTNAHVHPGHHPRLAHLHRALSNLRSVLPTPRWHTDWADAHARLDELRRTLGDGLWAQALSRVTATDRDLIDHLLSGAIDT